MKEIKIVSFEEWWSFIGSGLPKERIMNGAKVESLEDDEEFAKRISSIAWKYCKTLCEDNINGYRRNEN